MSATSGHNVARSRSHLEARHRTLERLLESYGVLTYDSLRELSHADRWETPLSTVLDRAIAAGRVRRLSGDLYEAGSHDDPAAA